MSNALTAAALPLAMSPTDKLVLLVLADAARDPGDAERPAQAWPPITGKPGKLGLAERTCLTDRAVRAALRRLEAAGHITTTPVPGRGSVYTVHPRNDVPVGTSFRPEPPSERAERPSPKPLTTTNPQKASPSSGARKGAAPRQLALIETLPDLPPSVTADQWNGFVQMRLAMQRGSRSRPWTVAAAKGIIRDLHRLVEDGEDPGEALERSTVNGWAGVRFDNGGSNGNGRGARWRRGQANEHPGGRDCAAAARVFGSMEG